MKGIGLNAEIVVLLELAEVTIKWWEGKRPVEWTLEQHLDQCQVNCSTDLEKQLARLVSILVRNQKGLC